MSGSVREFWDQTDKKTMHNNNEKFKKKIENKNQT
jgi:hypothetical protein